MSLVPVTILLHVGSTNVPHQNAESSDRIFEYDPIAQLQDPGHSYCPTSLDLLEEIE